MRNIRSKKLRANIALTAVILISGVLLTSGVALTVLVVDVSISGVDYRDRSASDLLMNTCLEEAAYKLRTDKNYTGVVNVSLAGNTCTGTITVNPVNSGFRDIALTANFQNHQTTANYTLNVSTNPYQFVL